MKILVLGGDGMLGHKMFQTLRAQWPETYCTLRRPLTDQRYARIDLFHEGNVIDGLEAADLGHVEQVLADMQPDMVVNCIGVIKQRSDAAAAIPSITINSLLPHRLAQWCANWGGRLIHFSTDCVFSGKHGSYAEDQLSDAEDLYGRTKALGEVAAANAVTIRTSIIGRELFNFKSLLEWLLSQQHKVIRGFTHHYYSGTTTLHLAQTVKWLIEEHPHLSGLYQLASDPISKHDLLCLLREAYKIDVEIQPDDEPFCDRSLVGSKFANATGYVCPPWNELIAALAKDPTPYERWR